MTTFILSLISIYIGKKCGEKWGKKAEIVVLSNLNSDQRIADFLEKGAYDYLLKSNWSIEELVKKVKDKIAAKGQ